MDEPASRQAAGRVEPPADRLDSWKDIAAYLARDISTAQRWERREGMPVHRHVHRTLGSVYAFRTEIDAWRQQRGQRPPDDGRETAAAPPEAPSYRAAILFAGVFAAGILAHALWSGVFDSRSGSPAGVTAAADQEYLFGRYFLWRYDEEHLGLAIRHFERATQLDPGHAAAFAALSNAWWARGMFGAIDLQAAEQPARQAAAAALALDDGFAAAHVARADVLRLFDRDLAGAERAAQIALQLDPESLEAHHSYALLLMGLGRFPEALAHIARAAALDPLAPAVQSNFGRILYRAGRFDEAVPRFLRALELEPGMRVHYARLGDVYDQLGQYERALEAYDRSGLQDPSYQANVARVLARMGRSDDARRLLARLDGERSRPPLWEAAAAYAALNDTDEAIRLLGRLVEGDAPGMPYFRVDPQFATLHGAPQWAALVQRANGPAAPPR